MMNAKYKTSTGYEVYNWVTDELCLSHLIIKYRNVKLIPYYTLKQCQRYISKAYNPIHLEIRLNGIVIN